MIKLQEILENLVGGIPASCEGEDPAIYEKENYDHAKGQIKEALIDALVGKEKNLEQIIKEFCK